MAHAHKKILCIDDDRKTAELIAEELSARDFKVSIANSSHEGLAAILNDMPDLVLCDISIKSRFDASPLAKGIASWQRQIPFVFLVALSDGDGELKRRRFGADDYITKPIDFYRLVLIINARLAKVARIRSKQRLKLNDREIHVLTWAARGKTSAEMARKFRMSKRTVDFHLDSARIKLGASTRTQAAIKAALYGLIKP
jgi:DNA-binding NarL/FixJ family response regulator